jgi:endonuclease/exonuclease/phosphatase family metal-dependent hydrolase
MPHTTTRRSRLITLIAGSLTALGLAAGAATTATAASAPDADAGPTVTGVTAEELHVMTFNLRYASDTAPNSWPERRPVMKQLLLQEKPTLIGTQEGLYRQLREIQADLPTWYDSIGEGREGGTKGEAMQVFYDSRRLDPLEYGHYWLSDTPEVVGSKTWGGCCPRMVTWIRFLDQRTGEEFYFVNTHLEAFDATTRAKSADLILERMGQFDSDVPVVMTGDFNEAALVGGTVYDKFVTNGPLVDTWETAEERNELYATFHGYRPLTPNGVRIDWVLTTPEVDVRLAALNTYSKGGQFPSDHLPVQAVVDLPDAD